MSDEQPRLWCEPQAAFGRLNVERRVWTPPMDPDPVQATKFEAAVVQNVMCLSVRRFKNEIGMAQEVLARQDERPDSFRAWNARLCGRRLMTLQDVSVLLRVVPGALPSEETVRTFLRVAWGGELPADWTWPDRGVEVGTPRQRTQRTT